MVICLRKTKDVTCLSPPVLFAGLITAGIAIDNRVSDECHQPLARTLVNAANAMRLGSGAAVFARRRGGGRLKDENI
jgi:hypothetical protein